MRRLISQIFWGALVVAVSGCGCSNSHEQQKLENQRMELELRLERLRAEREERRRVVEEARLANEKKQEERAWAERRRIEWDKALKNSTQVRDSLIAEIDKESSDIVKVSADELDCHLKRLRDEVCSKRGIKANIRDFAMKRQLVLWEELEELRARASALIARADEIEKECNSLGLSSAAYDAIIIRRDESLVELRNKEMLLERLYIEDKTQGL